MIALGLHGYDENARASVEALQWGLAQQLLAVNVDVILEWGFWSAKERQRLRDGAAALGAKTEIHFLDVDRHELVRRLTVRNALAPTSSFQVNVEDVDGWLAQFEPPLPCELSSRLIPGPNWRGGMR
ncbi:hypothetical protein K32_42310 [Kaistia sp. 32K]|nr:hypothetical protein K32_42310 [Kaistia sp. 32K]